MMNSEPIKIEAQICAPRSKVWAVMNDPSHIVNWNFAHESWCCPFAENDLREGGKLKCRLEARDKSFGFDFEGIYDEVTPETKIGYHMSDGRTVEIFFESIDENTTRIIQIFDPESENPIEMQKEGWNAILTNFKKYVEKN